MEFIPLVNDAQIKEGDLIVVKRRTDEIVMGKVWKIVGNNEVVYDKKNAYYFHLDMYLKGESSTKEVYIIKD